jgi:hypothetical protein
MEKHAVRDVAPSKDFAPGGWMIHCPACKAGHVLAKGTLQFNGDYNKPTFDRAVKVTLPPTRMLQSSEWVEFHQDEHARYRVPKSIVGEDCEPTIEAVAKALGTEPNFESVFNEVQSRLKSLPPQICHFEIKEGQIHYLEDSTHELVNETAPMLLF